MTLLDRLLGRDPTPSRPRTQKAVTALGPWANGIPLDSLRDTPQKKAAAFLRAYRVGWFYKAESKISGDIAGLRVQLMPEDAEGDNEQAIVPPDLDIPFDALAPVDQFLRLMERPNPFQTGRQLRRKTLIRRDMTGAAFWWLEGGDMGLPSAIYGISPARMWPAYDRRGNRIGWVMDHDSANPVAFSEAEIVAFVDDGPDDGYNPVGVVESVFAHVPLTERLAQHTADVLSTGGRLAGMLWPKERALGEDEYLDAQRAWRNVASDPNAARRLLIFPEPMEWSSGAASPRDIGIPELASLSRDEILTAFPISPYMLGANLSGGGLDNGGSSRREERRTYWEETIHPRVEAFEEDVQVQLLARYEEMVGGTFDFEVIEPNLDDATSLLEKAEAFKGLVSIGFDPEAAIEASGLDHIKWSGLPELLDPAKQAQAAEAAREAQTERLEQMAEERPMRTKVARREDIIGQELAGLDAALRRFLTSQRDRLVERIEATLPKQKALRQKAIPDDWWDADAEDRALADALAEPYRRIARGGVQAVADNLDRTVTRSRLDPLLRDALRAAGTRISGINEATRKAIADTLTEGVRRGYSIPQIVNGVADEGFKGVREAPLGNGLPAFDEYRAELIARTETMNAYNDAALRGYGSFGVREVLAIDGDEDDECSERDGRTYTIDDALSVTDHPNGTLDWAPV